MNKMLTHLNGYKREAVLAPLFKMLEATFDLFVPLVMADIVNVGIAAHDFHYILVRCGILLLLAVVGLACSLTAQYFSAKAAVGYSTSLRHALFEHIQRLGFTEMDTMGTSTLITRMTSDINQVQSGLNLFLRLFLRSPFVVVGAMVMAFTVNVRAAWIFVVAIPLLSVVVFGVMVITNPLYKTAQARLDRVLGLTRENLTGVRVVRAFDKEQSEIDRFESANDLLTRMQLHVGHISSLMSPLTYVIINLAIVALLYVGSIEINVGGMASGDVIALVNYMNQILVELVKLANLIVQVSKALACAGRVQAVLDTEPGMEFPAALKGEAPADKAGDAVRFDHVSLTYAGAGAPSLTDISFTAKRGQTIGVIGGTGSGKSSLINHILGENRLIVANEAGTTRDAIDTMVENKYGKFIFTDTAGLRKRGKVESGVERYSVLRSLAAVERSRVCVIMIDATVGFTEQDSKVAGYAHEQGKACIIAVNKWDAVEKDSYTMDAMRKKLEEDFSFMSYAPIVFISAKTGQRVDKLFETIHFVDVQNGTRVPTGALNEMLARATAKVQPPSDKGKRLKVFYVTQISTRPPTFVCFVNQKALFHFSYQRYLENQIRETFGLTGTPIKMITREHGDGAVKAGKV